VDLLRLIRKRPGLFVACILTATAPILTPLLIRAVVVYLVGPASH
jgi:hypothetical protein